MVAYAGRYTKDRARAEELAQEVFVKVYRTKSYSPDAQFKTWLYRVATNVCLNELRRAEHQHRTESMDDENRRGHELVAGDDASPEARVSTGQLAERLSRTLAELPDNQRAAFIMHRQQGLTHTEVADALATSVSAVKSLIHRALETLRKEATRAMRPTSRPAEAQ